MNMNFIEFISVTFAGCGNGKRLSLIDAFGHLSFYILTSSNVKGIVSGELFHIIS